MQADLSIHSAGTLSSPSCPPHLAATSAPLHPQARQLAQRGRTRERVPRSPCLNRRIDDLNRLVTEIGMSTTAKRHLRSIWPVQIVTTSLPRYWWGLARTVTGPSATSKTNAAGERLSTRKSSIGSKQSKSVAATGRVSRSRLQLFRRFRTIGRALRVGGHLLRSPESARCLDLACERPRNGALPRQ